MEDMTVQYSTEINKNKKKMVKSGEVLTKKDTKWIF